MRAGGLPRALNYLGVVIGVAGILTVVPALEVLGAVFGLGLIVWFVWLGIVVLRAAILTLKKASEEMDGTTESARPELIRRLASLLLSVFGISSFADKVDIIIPIPPDSDRYSVRGYHPPDELSKSISSQSTIPVTLNTLQKIRSTRDLRGLNRQERLAEIKDSMSVTDQKNYLINGMDVLLVDDVVTYGTHFKEARDKLLMAGARAVYGAVLATDHNNISPLNG